MGPRRVRGITAWAGLGLLGFLLVSPVGPEGTEPAATFAAVEDPGEPWVSPISWTGRLATQVCAPSGIASCTGIRQGDHHDLHILALDRQPDAVDLELRWDATSAGARELTLWLDGVIVRKTCEDCTSYRFRVLEKVEGTSPLRLHASDLELLEDEQLAILVRIPDDLPEPITADARPAQPFLVDGTVRGD